MESLYSWWEVPAIAHFFSLFKSCFSLSDFTIEELEEGLLSDGADERSTYFITRVLTELLQGYYDNTNITVTTCHDWLRQIMKERWEGIEGRINPLSSVEADFHELPLRLKVQIIHRITEYRLDAGDVENKLQGLNATDLRLEPLGSDRHGAKFWYFFGVRLYKESLHEDRSDGQVDGMKNGKSETKKKKKKKKKRRKGKLSNSFGIDPNNTWSVACYSVGDWKRTASQMKGTESRRERALMQLITENFLPNLPKIVDDMERQRVVKQQAEPRRSSCRLLARKLCQAEQEAEKKFALERAEKVRQEREERERMRGGVTTKRLQQDFERMLRLELERKWKEDANKKAQQLQDLYADMDSSSDDDVVLDQTTSPAVENHNSVPVKLGKRKNKTSRVKNEKKVKLMKKDKRKSELKKLKKQNSNLSETAKKWGKQPEKRGGWQRRGGWGRKRSLSHSKESEEEEGSDHDHEMDLVAMTKIIAGLQEHPEAWQFESPVDEAIAPGYHSIIKRPMDLSEIERKLGSGEYEGSRNFITDITLMFNNCRLYNGPESEYTEATDEIDELFRQLVKKHLPHVCMDDEISKHFTEPVRKTRRSIDEKQSEDELEEDKLLPGATTRAAWRSETVDTKPAPAKPKPAGRGRGRGGRGRGGRGRGRGRGRGGQAPRGRGERISRRLSSQRERKLSEKRDVTSGESEEEPDESKDAIEVEPVVNGDEERESVTEEVAQTQKSKTETPENVPRRSTENVSRRSSSSSSRNSSAERDAKSKQETPALDAESRAKPQNVWSLDFLASQARVLEEQQQQTRDEHHKRDPTTPGGAEPKKSKTSPEAPSEMAEKEVLDDKGAKHEKGKEKKQKESKQEKDAKDAEVEKETKEQKEEKVQKKQEEADDDIYSFKDEEEVVAATRFKRHGRESVISSTGVTSPSQAFPMTPAPLYPMTPTVMGYPMTPGYPDPQHRFQSPTRPGKRRSMDSSSPPTPSSSGYGSYNPTGRSSTPSEGVPTFNPPTPKVESSPEKGQEVLPQPNRRQLNSLSNTGKTATRRTSGVEETVEPKLPHPSPVYPPKTTPLNSHPAQHGAVPGAIIPQTAKDPPSLTDDRGFKDAAPRQQPARSAAVVEPSLPTRPRLPSDGYPPPVTRLPSSSGDTEISKPSPAGSHAPPRHAQHVPSQPIHHPPPTVHHPPVNPKIQQPTATMAPITPIANSHSAPNIRGQPPPPSRSHPSPASSRPYPSPKRPQLSPAPPRPQPVPASRPQPAAADRPTTTRSQPPPPNSRPQAPPSNTRPQPPPPSARPQVTPAVSRPPPMPTITRPQPTPASTRPTSRAPQSGSTRTPVIPVATKSQVTSRNSPRSATSYPDYGGINAAARYTHAGYDRSIYGAHQVEASTNHNSVVHQQNKNHPAGSMLLHNPTMASLGLNHWSLGGASDQRLQHEARQQTEQRKASLPGRGSVPVTPQPESRGKQRTKQAPATSPSSRSVGMHPMAQYPGAEYMGYHFPAHASPSPHDFSSQQNGLLSAATNQTLLHSADLTASATLRVLQQQQQHKPTDLPSHAAAAAHASHASMFLPTGHYPATPTQADQYNRLAATAAAQQHQLGMYHQTTNAQNPWLQLHHHSQMDPVYQLMQQHGQYPVYHNILHKY